MGLVSPLGYLRQSPREATTQDWQWRMYFPLLVRAEVFATFFLLFFVPTSKRLLRVKTLNNPQPLFQLMSFLSCYRIGMTTIISFFCFFSFICFLFFFLSTTRSNLSLHFTFHHQQRYPCWYLNLAPLSQFLGDAPSQVVKLPLIFSL